MGKFHRSNSRQATLKKKLTDRKNRVRRANAKALTQRKFQDVKGSVKDLAQCSDDNEQRKIRIQTLQNIQKNKRTLFHAQSRGLSDILLNAEKRDDQYSVKPDESPKKNDKHNLNQTFKNYYKEFKKVVEAADVILEVLDARDPLGSRCPQVEQTVINSGSGKRLVLVLNKIDLIPKDNLEKWLKYLRQELPTVAFKASTQAQRDHLSQSKIAAIHMSESMQSTRQCVGANFLMKVLGNYCRNQNILTSIRVGIVGFPNVGKSSIINSLKRCKTCIVGGTPGVTKIMQEVILDKHIRLLDSPGVIFAKEGSTSNLALRNAVKVEKLDDVIKPAESIIQRTSHQQLEDHYKVPKFSSCHDFLLQMAKKIGRFKKGGIPDADAAARKLINDWNSGLIKYYTQPPEIYERSSYISSEIVTEMGKAFDIASLESQMEIENLTIIGNDNETIEDMEPESNIVVDIKKKKQNIKIADKECTLPIELQQNRINKLLYKKQKKKRRKNEKMAAALSKTLDSLTLLGKL